MQKKKNFIVPIHFQIYFFWQLNTTRGTNLQQQRNHFMEIENGESIILENWVKLWKKDNIMTVYEMGEPGPASTTLHVHTFTHDVMASGIEVKHTHSVTLKTFMHSLNCTTSAVKRTRDCTQTTKNTQFTHLDQPPIVPCFPAEPPSAPLIWVLPSPFLRNLSLTHILFLLLSGTSNLTDNKEGATCNTKWKLEKICF